MLCPKGQEQLHGSQHQPQSHNCIILFLFLFIHFISPGQTLQTFAIYSHILSLPICSSPPFSCRNFPPDNLKFGHLTQASHLSWYSHGAYHSHVTVLDKQQATPICYGSLEGFSNMILYRASHLNTLYDFITVGKMHRCNSLPNKR